MTTLLPRNLTRLANNRPPQRAWIVERGLKQSTEIEEVGERLEKFREWVELVLENWEIVFNLEGDAAWSL